MKQIYIMALFCALSFAAKSQCIPPDEMYAINQTFTSVDITWSAGLPPAMEYIVKYRPVENADTTWLAVSVFNDSMVSIYSLDTCTGYEFNITAICDLTNSATTETDTFFTKCDTGTTNIPNEIFDHEMVIYPNPAHGIINIRFDEPVFGDVVVIIRNSSGVLLNGDTYFLSGEMNIEQIPMMEYNKGMHYITVVYNGSSFTKQVFGSDL